VASTARFLALDVPVRSFVHGQHGSTIEPRQWTGHGVNTSEGPTKRPRAIARILLGLVVLLAASAPVAALVFAVLYLFQIRPIS
jgi:hypothetical protein